jgi:hypothetical protein
MLAGASPHRARGIPSRRHHACDAARPAARPRICPGACTASLAGGLRWARTLGTMTADPTTERPELSVVIPMFNEQEVLPLLAQRLRPVLDGLTERYEVVCVDDGSRDLTPALLHKLAREWAQVRVVRLRANAGHQAAISAGLARARGDYMVTIDADLQDPPGGDRRDAADRPARRGRRRLWGALGPLDRLGVQADHRPDVLLAHPPDLRHDRAVRRGRLPADVPGHRRCRQQPARHQPGAALRRAGAGFPVGECRLPPGGAGRRAPRSIRSSRCSSSRSTR